ncbi:rhomboid family intramembrane serine protease [Methylomonas sp. MED-D]|uniref:Rhomboid family intramembrane serine protease n=1 Tax=Methylomonas koyamae TaxID=702114 RepID=A0A177NCP6_9GAMM|nr:MULTISPECIES: rhomboid family intramembrane serine protease [Methylomonas]MDT4329091.1 rhomboid family intramembrane serine protease [Methylomonas sp. MV1]OAI15675.1 rhomboid family intramembrane serine protease [Methylomonas koyamae]OHX36436.1 rhomboid family intramembrane serine protease [Methylomonas sp. LWB]
MIPIRDSIPCQTKPYVTWAVMAVCTAVYVAMLFMPDEVGQHFVYLYGMVPIRYSNPDWAYAFGLPPDHYLSFLTSLFLHGGFLHLLMNMVFLWIFADNIEDLMGHWRFLAFYLVSGLLATVTQWYFYPNIAIPVVGASGAIAGVLGAYFVRFPYATVVIMVPILFYPLFFQVPAIAFLGFWVIVQVGDVFTAAMFDNVAVDSAWWAHLGGFAVGALLHPFFIDKPAHRRELSPPAE